MNNRNTGINVNRLPANRSHLISSLRHILVQRDENDQNEQSGSNNNEEEPVLTREVLQAVWSRMQTLPPEARSSLLNTMNRNNQSSQESANTNQEEDSENEDENENEYNNRITIRSKLYIMI